MSVIQFVDQLLPGESLANDALAIHAHLVAAGMESMLHEFRPLRSTPGQPPESLTAGRDRDSLLLHVREPEHSQAAFVSWKGPVVLRDHGAWWTAGRTLASPQGRQDWDDGELRLRPLYQRADMVLAVSEAASQRAQRLGTDVSRIVVVPPLFPADQFLGDGADRDVERPNILVVGRLDPHAGLGAVLNSFHLFASNFHNHAVLTVVGRSNPAWLHGAFNEAVGAYRLNCRLLGHVSQQELVSEYRKATVLLALSEATGFGVRVAEALINGLPVVARSGSDGAVAQTLGGCGILLDTTDSETVVAEALREVVDDAAMRRHLQVSGRERGAQFQTSLTAPIIVDALRRFS
jgi:glycosyltransferase involved in cell wall biosynthesis